MFRLRNRFGSAIVQMAHLLTLWLCSITYGECADIVTIPWRGDFPHNNEKVWSKDYDLGWSKNFLNGTPQESGVVRRSGFLNAEIYTPPGAGPHPFVIMMHGCGGFDATARRWIAEYSARLNNRGYGVLALDSFSTRNVKESCGEADGHWARRRSEDAYSAMAYLLQRQLAVPGQVILMGRSNGANATLMALEEGPMARGHTSMHFAGGIALIPPCAGRKNSDFYAPVLVFIGDADDANDPNQCVELGRKPRLGKPAVRVIVYKGANHGYLDRGQPRVFHGWHLSHHAGAAEDTKRSIEEAVKTQMSAFGPGVEVRTR